MGVKKKWSEKLRRDVFGYDAEVGGRRVRKFGFSTQAAAELALATGSPVFRPTSSR